MRGPDEQLQTPLGTPRSLRGAGRPAKLWRTCHRCVTSRGLGTLRRESAMPGHLLASPPTLTPKSPLHRVGGEKLVKHPSDVSLLEMLLSHRGLERKTRTQPTPVPSPAPRRSAQQPPPHPRPLPRTLPPSGPPVVPSSRLTGAPCSPGYFSASASSKQPSSNPSLHLPVVFWRL